MTDTANLGMPSDERRNDDDNNVHESSGSLMRLVEISTNTGKVLRVFGVNFTNDAQIHDYATGYLQLPSLDLDEPLWWQLSPNRAITVDTGTNRS